MGIPRFGSVSRHVFNHVRLLPEGPGADLADEGLLPGVYLEVLLEVEPLRVDEQAAHRAALVVRPVVIHVNVEVVQIMQDNAALDTVDRPQVVLYLMLVLAHLSVVVAAAVVAGAVAAAVHGQRVATAVAVVGRRRAGLGVAVDRRRDGRLEGQRRLGEMLQRQFSDSSAILGVVVDSGN